MVSNEEIRRKLEGRRKGNPQDIISGPNELTSDDLVCPSCGTSNPSISNFCSECRKNLKETLAYYEGPHSMRKNIHYDLEITPNSIIKYNKGYFNGKRTGKSEVYDRTNIKNIKIYKTLSQLHFTYNGKIIALVILKKNLEELEKLLVEEPVEEHVHETVESYGYIICDACYGVHKLSEFESPEYYQYCPCGGNYHYIENIEDVEPLTKLCMLCGAENPYSSERCSKCGKIFKNSILYLRTKPYDIEFTYKFIRVYYKKNKTILRVNKYAIDKIINIRLSLGFMRYYFKFDYNDEHLSLRINPEQAKLVEELFEVAELNLGICPNVNCEYNKLLKEKEHCPKCGSISKIISSDSYEEHLKTKKQEKAKRRKEKERKEHANKMKKKEDEKKKYIQDKKIKYRCLKVAKGINGRLELYDNRIRFKVHGSGNEDYLIEEIISIDFKPAGNGILQYGTIHFHIRGMHREKSKPGGMVFYNPRAGYTIGLGSTGGTQPPQTGLTFEKKWEPEFWEIKNIVQAKIRESNGLKTSAKSEPKTTSYNELEKLAELRDKGIITEEEFQMKKKQILGL